MRDGEYFGNELDIYNNMCHECYERYGEHRFDCSVYRGILLRKQEEHERSVHKQQSKMRRPKVLKQK